MKRILVAMGDIPPTHPDGLDILRRETVVEVATHLLSEDELVARIKDFNAVILGAPRLTRRVLLAADNLEVISRGGIGVDNIDIPYATERGIVVTNVLDTLSKTVAEHTMMFMLGLSREIIGADRAVRSGGWKDFAKISHHEVSGKTIGIVGLGSIGVAVAQMARRAFEMQVLTNSNPHLKRGNIDAAEARVVSLDELLRDSDYVVLSVPLNKETEKLLGERELGLMKRTSYLINVARGKVVDQGALLRVLTEKRIAGAALDVLERQPPNPNDPILRLENVIFTPHDAAITVEAGRKAGIAIANSILQLFKGELPGYPINLLNPQVARAYTDRVKGSSPV